MSRQTHARPSRRHMLLPLLTLLFALPATAHAQPPPRPGVSARVSRLERLVDRLQSRVAQLEAATQPQEVTVNCSGGASVQAVIDANAWNPARLTIEVVGLCDENLFIGRDNVWIRGRGPGDGFAPSSGSPVTLRSARRISLVQLTIRTAGSSDSGVDISFGSEFTLGALDVEGGFAGISIFDSVGHVYGTSVRNSGRGASLKGGAVSFNGFTAEDVALGFQVYHAGTIDVSDSLIRNTSSWGLSLSDGSVLRMFTTTVENSVVGIFLTTGSQASVGGGSVIRGSTAQGIRAWNGSTLLLGGGAVVEQSAGDGVLVLGGSLLVPFQTTIRDNGGNGVSLADTSVAQGGDQAQILGNTAWGIFCGTAPAVAQVTGPGYDATLVTGNGSGASNCPSLGEPGRVP